MLSLSVALDEYTHSDDDESCHRNEAKFNSRVDKDIVDMIGVEVVASILDVCESPGEGTHAHERVNAKIADAVSHHLESFGERCSCIWTHEKCERNAKQPDQGNDLREFTRAFEKGIKAIPQAYHHDDVGKDHQTKDGCIGALACHIHQEADRDAQEDAR